MYIQLYKILHFAFTCKIHVLAHAFALLPVAPSLYRIEVHYFVVPFEALVVDSFLIIAVDLAIFTDPNTFLAIIHYAQTFVSVRRSEHFYLWQLVWIWLVRHLFHSVATSTVCSTIPGGLHLVATPSTAEAVAAHF